MNIYINPLAYHKMQQLTALSPVEVSGIGPVVMTHGRLYIPDFFVPKQTNSHTETEFDGQSMTDTLLDSMDAYKGAPLSFWWHSHVDMGVSQSCTDVTTMRAMASRGFCVATIINKRGEISTMYCSKGDIGNYIPPFELGAKLLMWTPEDHKVKELYDERCIRRTYNPAPYRGNHELIQRTPTTLLSIGNNNPNHADSKRIIEDDEDEKTTLTQKEAYALAKNWQFEYNTITKKSNTLKVIIKNIFSVIEQWEYIPKDAKDLHDCTRWLIEDNTNGGEYYD